MRYAAVLLAHAGAMTLALALVDAGLGFALWSWSAIAVVVALIVLLHHPGRWRPAVVTLAPLAVIAATVAWTILLGAIDGGLILFLVGPLTFVVSLAVAALFALIALGRALARVPLRGG